MTSKGSEAESGGGGAVVGFCTTALPLGGSEEAVMAEGGSSVLGRLARGEVGKEGVGCVGGGVVIVDYKNLRRTGWIEALHKDATRFTVESW